MKTIIKAAALAALITACLPATAALPWNDCPAWVSVNQPVFDGDANKASGMVTLTVKLNDIRKIQKTAGPEFYDDSFNMNKWAMVLVCFDSDNCEEYMVDDNEYNRLMDVLSCK